MNESESVKSEQGDNRHVRVRTSTWRLLKALSDATEESMAHIVRRLIKEEWRKFQKAQRRGEER